MFERSHLSIGGVVGHSTNTTTPRYLDGKDCLVQNYNLNFWHVKEDNFGLNITCYHGHIDYLLVILSDTYSRTRFTLHFRIL